MLLSLTIALFNFETNINFSNKIERSCQTLYTYLQFPYIVMFNVFAKN